MTRRLRFLVAVVLTVGATALTAPGAVACSGASHCYGYASWDPPTTYTGGLASLNASRLSVSNPSSTWINHEMWVTTSAAGANQWVEAGLTHGLIDGTNYGRAFFWAEYNTSGSYAEHFVQNIALSTTYVAKISYSGSGSWGIYLNGNQVGGSSHDHGSYTGRLQVGGETLTDNAQLEAIATNLQKRGADNSSWSYDWGGSIYQAGMQAGWGTYAKSMWDRFN